MVPPKPPAPQCPRPPEPSTSQCLLKLLIILLVTPLGSWAKVHNIYWNSTNPLLHSTQPLLVNMDQHQFSFDQAHIICPSGEERSEKEAYHVYSVSRTEFDTCRLCEIGKPHRLLADCSSPGIV